MTEKSYFWNGTALNDAQEAPYNAASFANLINRVYASGGAYVLPDEGNGLLVSTSAGMVVSIATGKAFIYGYWFENTSATTVTLSGNSSGYGRYDRIVVQIDTENETVSVEVLEGLPEANPDPPELNTCSTLLQLPLARIYVPDSAAAIQSYYIFDERKFANNVYHINTYSRQNNFFNGDFMAFTHTSSGINIPPNWQSVLNVYSMERFDTMKRGRTLRTKFGTSGSPMTQTVLTSENYTDRFTLSLTIQVYSGEAAISFGGISVRVPATGSPHKILLRPSTTGYQDLSIGHQITNSDFRFSDIRLAHGWCEARQIPRYEQVLMFDSSHHIYQVDDASSGTGNFGTTSLAPKCTTCSYPDEVATILPETKSLILGLRARDSGSAGSNNVLVQLRTFSGTIPVAFFASMDGAPNDTWRYSYGIVGLEQNMIGYTVIASGAGTCDFDVFLLGIIV